ncbi:succinylglutamate desuccinylase/aspartoacylase family protein [Candidatus Sumerlaeota bacterium]|nr:succinylglutamate desuccinylase/aspartoacylase family protein [Candidatus Sumerlaeota bacterium]
MRILTGSDLSHRRLPLMSAVSPEPGPTVWLTACSHGDEIGGIVVIQEIFRVIRRWLRRGSVHAFPLMNPIGFETATRHIPVSSEDLNRSFPGEPTGTLGKRIAHRIFETIMDSGPALVLDLHHDWIKSIPYALIDSDEGALPQGARDRTREFAQQTGLPVVMDSDVIPSSLSHNLLRREVPALTLELGESYIVNERNVEFGLGAIWNLLDRLEMTEPQAERFQYPLVKPSLLEETLRYSDRPFSSRTGIVRFMTKPGDMVREGQPIARVVNAFGKLMETVRAVGDAIVLGHTDSGVVFPGMPIMAFGLEPGEKKISP